MKGIAESTIVKIIIALIVIGVIVTLLYLALGPFRESIAYNSCKAQVSEYCNLHGLKSGDSIQDPKAVPCIEKVKISVDRPPLSQCP